MEQESRSSRETRRSKRAEWHPLRSLRLWMAFRVHGAAQYRAWIEGTLANARRLTELVEAAPEFELLHEP